MSFKFRDFLSPFLFHVTIDQKIGEGYRLVLQIKIDGCADDSRKNVDGLQCLKY